MARERIEARNALESYTYQVKNTISDPEKLGDKISEDDKSAIQAAVDETIQWLDNNREAEKDEYDVQHEELEKIVKPIFSKLYEGAGGAGGGGGGGGYDGGSGGYDDEL